MSDPSQELELRSAPTHAVDLRVAATDSWTSVLDDVIALARGVAGTEFVPTGLRGSVEKVSAAVLYARELGLPPMTGLGSTHVIEGKAGISAELMRALVLQAGHELTIIENSRQRCVMRGRRKGSDVWTEAAFTLQEASEIRFKTKNGWQPLTTKSNWQNYPADMLLARATTRLCRMVFPDVVHGMRSVEELSDQIETVEVEPAESAPAPAKVSRRKATSAAPAAALQPDPVPVPVPVPEPPKQTSTAPAPTPAPPSPEPSKPKPDPEPADDGEDAGVEDAVIVEDEPTPSPPELTVVQGEETPQPVSQRLLAVIQQHFGRLGIDDRDERLHWARVISGHDQPLTTTKELTHTEGRTLAAKLEKLRDRDALEALGAAQ